MQLAVQVKDGVFHAEKGTEGKPDWLTVEAAIQLDGSAELFAQGLTNDGIYSVGGVPPGSPYSYRILAKFEGASGTGSRVELRLCTFTALNR